MWSTPLARKRVEHELDHRATAHRTEDFGEIRFHSGPFAGGQNNSQSCAHQIASLNWKRQQTEEKTTAAREATLAASPRSHPTGPHLPRAHPTVRRDPTVRPRPSTLASLAASRARSRHLVTPELQTRQRCSEQAIALAELAPARPCVSFYLATNGRLLPVGRGGTPLPRGARQLVDMVPDASATMIRFPTIRGDSGPRCSRPKGTSLEEAIAKADTLIEALGWIRQFRDKVTVIKLGGSVMEDDTALRHVLIDIVFMETVGMRPVVVHGGGAAISRAMQ